MFKASLARLLLYPGAPSPCHGDHASASALPQLRPLWPRYRCRRWPRPPVAWLRRRFRPWGPTEMAAATTALSLSSVSSVSSSSAALLRPGWAPLRRWRTLARSTSSFPRSAASDEATVISGTKLARQVLKEVRRDVESWISAGNQRPHLTVILVGDNPASHIYVRNKIKAAAAVGISSEIILRPKDISQEELLDMTVKLNEDSRVSGLLVQLPLPDHIDERAVCNAIAPEKDVDGFHIMNIGRLCLDQPSVIPATAAAVWEIIKRTGIQTFGKNVLVAGRSKNVGMPISMLLHTDGEHERPGGDATVTITHRYTPKEQLKIHTQLADIVIVAAGWNRCFYRPVQRMCQRKRAFFVCACTEDRDSFSCVVLLQEPSASWLLGLSILACNPGLHRLPMESVLSAISPQPPGSSPYHTRIIYPHEAEALSNYQPGCHGLRQRGMKEMQSDLIKWARKELEILARSTCEAEFQVSPS
ncbi:probable bifunctional methylenetetrahydrofolate dehydrogenase/cyclohydrolase 2 isoform X3 [Motacilla alba alba]|uniref:probable bifunctional methylenetetrahydrofolate dehydrogenase/cyclohydrolase 2 isoform X3 n=1 Tax=Motacilla alba alba TaxID=1094192 RepID=UPI0018D52351|nr:probable bifunctional methylenetetrahydrofolate dehydrogenase/cyclohydrolase 2 isoform X3 [Motacilla alba alba]XP_037991283.1 probable bifunctional methylenetetrahydrofolate dehydrogenase/cyclohydrolase 2 isoform X3 [Motacilla alba alba]XP_037991284.1 probable bifunctional methylenetetrahydrofolate dehydrogenase/cyclohydrolase 2 isoform X3 [Motacilla alba alba]